MKHVRKYETVENPLYNHNLRMEKNYRPKYRSGLIAIRFKDDEKRYNKKYQDVDEETGKYRVDYQNLFSEKGGSDFVNYFEDKYGIKMSKYRMGSDDYYYYFKCKPGEEKQKIEEIAKDEIVKDVDYVDVRGLIASDELQDIGSELEELSMKVGEISSTKFKKKLEKYIERLKKLL
jgi:hypothetical protein